MANRIVNRRAGGTVAGDVILTAQLYRKLDLIARQHGYVIEVEDLGGDWGRMNMLCTSIYLDVRDKNMRAMDGRTINLAPRIEVHGFWTANRPEIDLQAIPRGRIYEFVLWHELGHYLDNFDFLSVQLDKDEGILKARDEWHRSLRNCNELLADRFAWRAMFGDTPVPVSARGAGRAGYFAEWLEKLEARYPRKTYKGLGPFGPDPLTYVPYRHLYGDLPFVRPSDRRAVREPLVQARAAVIDELLSDAARIGLRVWQSGDPDDHPLLEWDDAMQERLAIKSRIESAAKMLEGEFRRRINLGLPDRHAAGLSRSAA